MRFYLGSDHAGLAMKDLINTRLRELGHETVDLGTHDTASCDYPDFAHAVSSRVGAEPGTRGVLICGTGLGMMLAANRHAGVRAVLCHHEVEARLSREHNDANILVLGARIMGDLLALQLLEVFLTTPFAGGRHQRRVDKIDQLASEQKNN